MTGLPEFNFPEFFRIESKLHAMGWEVFNPARHDEEMGIDVRGTTGDPKELSTFDLRVALRWDMQRILECDAIYMLKGWEKSSGARAEHALATAINLQIRYQ